MKNIFLIALLFLSFAAKAQRPDTLAVGDYTSEWYSTDTRAFRYHIADTVTVADTIFTDGDTIVNVVDTVIVDFPSFMGTAFAGMMTVATDSIVDMAQGDIAYVLYQSTCDECPYYAITATDGSHTAPPDDAAKYFQVRGGKLRLFYRAINGTSKIDAWILLKPSSIANNASN